MLNIDVFPLLHSLSVPGDTHSSPNTLDPVPGEKPVAGVWRLHNSLPSIQGRLCCSLPMAVRALIDGQNGPSRGM
jgi:hypothetical protein